MDFLLLLVLQCLNILQSLIQLVGLLLELGRLVKQLTLEVLRYKLLFLEAEGVRGDLLLKLCNLVFGLISFGFDSLVFFLDKSLEFMYSSMHFILDLLLHLLDLFSKRHLGTIEHLLLLFASDSFLLAALKCWEHFLVHLLLQLPSLFGLVYLDLQELYLLLLKCDFLFIFLLLTAEILFYFMHFFLDYHLVSMLCQTNHWAIRANGRLSVPTHLGGGTEVLLKRKLVWGTNKIVFRLVNLRAIEEFKFVGWEAWQLAPVVTKTLANEALRRSSSPWRVVYGQVCIALIICPD